MTHATYTNELKKSGYQLHHTASTRDYVSRQGDSYKTEPYTGRFGNGQKVLIPSWESTRYCTVEYWIN